MATVEERYATAIAYVRRAVAIVEMQAMFTSFDPITAWIEWYAGRTKTEEPRNELTHIEARWRAAGSADQRANVARDAELLADRVEESLPGAPQDRARTNLYPGERPSATPPNNYTDELDRQAHATWDWLKGHAHAGADETRSFGKWLLIGGGVVASWKLLDYVRAREQRQDSVLVGRKLNTNLVRAASARKEPRDAATRSTPRYSLRLSRGEVEALHFLRGRYSSAEAFFDGLTPLDESAEQALGREYDRREGSYRFQISEADVRKTLRATKGDGGNYGVIPNLRSPSIEWALSQERSSSP